MKKTKIVKLLAATAMATVLSNAAHSQVTVSGYVEMTYMNGGFNGATNSPAGRCRESWQSVRSHCSDHSANQC